jgi:hypothetical protein
LFLPYEDVKSHFFYRPFAGKQRFPGKNSNIWEQIERKTNLIVGHILGNKDFGKGKWQFSDVSIFPLRRTRETTKNALTDESHLFYAGKTQKISNFMQR